MFGLLPSGGLRCLLSALSRWTASRQPGRRILGRLPFPVACVALALGVASVAGAQSTTGSIKGRVQNSASGNYLNSARVRVMGTTREAFTSNSGEFSLPNLPAGPATLDVFYTGLAPQQVTVNVPAGGTVEQDFSLVNSSARNADGSVNMTEFVVAGQKETDAAAIAINSQRFAPNRVDVVSTDAFGDINQGNIGEFVKFLPGISLDTKDGNTPSGIMVRGFDPNFTGVTLDGGQLASTIISNTQTSSRQFVLDQATINNIARIEVVKVPTPDLSANLLGGSVNFVSKSAFESPRRQISFRTFFSANSKVVDFEKSPGPGRDDSYKILPSVDFTLIEPINKRLGFVVTFANYSQYYFNNQSVVGHRFNTGGATIDNPILANVNTTYNPVRKDNTSGSVKVDWKPWDRSVLEFNAQASAARNESLSRQIQYNVGGGIPTAYNSHDTVGLGGTAGTGTANLQNSGQMQHQLTRQLGTRYTFTGNDWEFELAGSYSNSNNRVRDTANGLFNTISSTLRDVKQVNLAGYDSSVATLAQAQVFDGAGARIDELKLDNYNLTSVNSQPMNAQDNVKEARLNITRKLNLGTIPMTLKTGGLVNDFTRDIEYTTLTWNYLGPLAAAGDENLGGFADQESAGQSPGYGRPGPQWPSLFKIYDTFKANPSYFTRTDTQQGDTVRNAAIRSPWLREKITAGYLMADTKLFHNRLRLLGGVRYELTENEGMGYKQDGNAIFQRDANGNLIVATNAQGVRSFVRKPEAGPAGGAVDQGLIYQYRKNYASRDYHGYYPSIHGTFNLTENLLLRAAFAKTIGRPNLSDIVPNLAVSDNVNFGDGTSNGSFPGFVTASNSTLVPFTAKNYDYSIEWYLPHNGMLSYNVYRKDIRNFISTRTAIIDAGLASELGLSPSTIGYQYTTRVNVSDARITGWEASLQFPLENLASIPMLDGLADWSRHFFAIANVTHLDLTGSRIGPADFKRYIPRGRNFGLRFNFAKFNGDVLLNWRGRLQRDTSSLLPDGREYIRARYQLDANIAYVLAKHYSVFAGCRNILNAPTEWEVTGPGAPAYSTLTNNQTFGAQFSLGIKGTY